MIIKLVKPTVEYKNQVLDYKQEFLAVGDNLAGTAGLEQAETFEEWYQGTINFSNEKTVPNGLVQSDNYLAIDENNRLVGMVDIRHRLNEHLLNFGGHIGYSVRISDRRKGYATKILEQALQKCKELGIEKALITCDKHNMGSEKVILNNHGVFENELTEAHGNVVKRYWINL